MSSKLEYLKKYMAEEEQEDDGGGTKDGSEKKAKKTKKRKGHRSKVKTATGLKIIDGDLMTAKDERRIFATRGPDERERLGQLQKRVESDVSDGDEDMYALKEELPEVAGVLDERPREMTGKWKKLGQESFPLSQPEPKRPRHDSSSSSASSDGGAAPVPGVERKLKGSDEKQAARKVVPRAVSVSKSDVVGRGRGGPLDSPRLRQRHDSSDDDDDSDISVDRRTNKRRPDGRNLEAVVDDDDGRSSPPPRSSGFEDRRRPSNRGRHSDSDCSPPRAPKDSDGDMSPPRRRNEEEDCGPLSKTLDGKKAGLQSAKGLRQEMESLRSKEKDRIDALSDEISGKGAKTVVRGRLRAKEEEEQRRKEKAAIPAQVQEQYSRWGKGLKQVEHQRARLESDLHEMSRPLARSKDDDKLESHLKGVERQEDPMLDYIRKKQKSREIKSGIPVYPEYKGPPPPPNRFNLKPGYRWDGVDRSNGFEKRLFENQNKRKAMAEEAYKWSSADI